MTSFAVMDVVKAATELERSGRQIFHLEVGQPATPAPAAVRAAAARAMAQDRLGYTVAAGMPALRERIAEHYRLTQGCHLPIERIIVTTGSSGAFLLAFLAAFDPGDRVAVTIPGYPCYRNILSSLGIEVVPVRCGPEAGYQPSVEQLAAIPDLRGLILASPANPTGTIIDRMTLSRLARHCEHSGIRLISDEIYHGLSYGQPAVSAATVSDEAIVINSFSKYFSMTGWRIGWMVLPEALVRPAEKLAQNYFISAPSLSQHAALAAFDSTDELEAHRARYRANRDVMLEALRSMGLTTLAPAEGAFYVYADVGHITQDTAVFCRNLLDKTGVAVTPGTDFDPLAGFRSIRLSYCTDSLAIEKAMDLIGGYLITG